jgi:DNA-binding CsgD family transcriptional regulator
LTVLFGTLGWRPQSLIPSIRSTEGLERVVVYHSDHAKSRDARGKVMEFCRSLGVAANGVELSDAFDLIQCALRIREDVRREKNATADLRFNIAGGTRLMSSAALLVCILEGIPATYVHDDTYQEIPLPLLRLTYGEALTPKQREVLAFLVKNREKRFSETSLARALGVHKATMNHHLRRLELAGAVEREKDPEDGRRLILKPAPGMELLVG